MDRPIRQQIERLKNVKKIYTTSPEFAQLPFEIKKKIFEYPSPGRSSSGSFQRLEKQDWLRRTIPYFEQKHPAPAPPPAQEKWAWQWFLQVVAFMLFHGRRVRFEVVSNDHHTMNAVLTIEKDREKGRFHLVLERDLPRQPPPINPRSMVDMIRTTTCEIEFRQRSPYGAPYALLTTLFILSQKYRFPLYYTGDHDDTCETVIRHLGRWYYHGDADQRKTVGHFLEYPIDFHRVRHTLLKKYQREFINCARSRLHMRSFPRTRAPPKLTVTDFFTRFDEPDYDD